MGYSFMLSSSRERSMGDDLKIVEKVPVSRTLTPARSHDQGARSCPKSGKTEQEPLGAVQDGVREADAQYLGLVSGHRDVAH